LLLPAGAQRQESSGTVGAVGHLDRLHTCRPRVSALSD